MKVITEDPLIEAAVKFFAIQLMPQYIHSDLIIVFFFNLFH